MFKIIACLIAPVDHGQDSLASYLTRTSLIKPLIQQKAKTKSLLPNTNERHQSKWLSIPLKPNITLLTPPFHSLPEIIPCLTISHICLLCVDCSMGLTPLCCAILHQAIQSQCKIILSDQCLQF